VAAACAAISRTDVKPSRAVAGTMGGPQAITPRSGLMANVLMRR